MSPLKKLLMSFLLFIVIGYLGTMPARLSQSRAPAAADLSISTDARKN